MIFNSTIKLLSKSINFDKSDIIIVNIFILILILLVILKYRLK